MLVIFRIVLLLSAAGGAAALILLALKPLTSRVFSAKWRYYIWIAVLAVMVLPLPFPHRAQTRIPSLPLPAPVLNEPVGTSVSQAKESDAVPISEDNADASFDWLKAAAIVWAAGMCVYFTCAAVSYARFTLGKKRASAPCNIDIALLRDAAKKAGVKKVPRVRVGASTDPPMLAGVLRPVIYLPDREIDGSLEMVLVHELTHYRRRDLIYKLATLIVNGIHWFNPLMYVVTANINEECEVSCDAEITRNMTDEEKKTYMNTILNLIHR